MRRALTISYTSSVPVAQPIASRFAPAIVSAMPPVRKRGASLRSKATYPWHGVGQPAGGVRSTSFLWAGMTGSGTPELNTSGSESERR